MNDAIATFEDDPPRQPWSRRAKLTLATLGIVSFSVLAAIAAWGAVYGTRSGHAWSLRELPLYTHFSADNATGMLQELPVLKALEWRYMPMRGQWVVEGQVDPELMQDLLSSRLDAASVTRSQAGVSFTIHEPGTLTIGSMDAASGMLRMVTWVREGGPVKNPVVMTVAAEPRVIRGHEQL
jgi:hypothetical protein